MWGTKICDKSPPALVLVVKTTSPKGCWNRVSLNNKQTNGLWLQLYTLPFSWFPLVNQIFSNIWFGWSSVVIGVVYVNNWQRWGRLHFLRLCKSRKSFKTKTYSFVSFKKKNICKKKKKIEKIWCKYGLHKYLCNEPWTLHSLVKENAYSDKIQKLKLWRRQGQSNQCRNPGEFFKIKLEETGKNRKKLEERARNNKTRRPGYAGAKFQSPYPHINFH